MKRRSCILTFATAMTLQLIAGQGRAQSDSGANGCPNYDASGARLIRLALREARLAWFRRANGLMDANEQHLYALTNFADSAACAKLNGYYSRSMFSRAPWRGSYYRLDASYFASFIDLTDPRVGRVLPSHFAMFDSALALKALLPDSLYYAQAFAQRFYDWYATFVHTNRLPYPAWWWILSDSSSYLDSGLASALRADSAAQRIKPVSREVLNVDPFLNSQDPCPRYSAVDVARDSAGYRVRVEPLCGDSTSQYSQTLNKVTVVQIVPDGRQWRIANVFYDRGAGLKGLLCGMATADARPERRPPKC